MTIVISEKESQAIIEAQATGASNGRPRDDSNPVPPEKSASQSTPSSPPQPLSIPENLPSGSSKPMSDPSPSAVNRADQTPTEAPPAYSPSRLSTSSPLPGSPVVLTEEDENARQAINHLYIKEQYKAIKGVWRLDPTLHVPPPLLPKLEEGMPLHNMLLESGDYGLGAQVILSKRLPREGASDGQIKERADIYLGTRNGGIDVILYRRDPDPRLNMSVQSDNGHIIIRVPRNYFGPITYTTEYGVVWFSQGIKAAAMQFSKQNSTGKIFLGDWSGSDYGRNPTWDGDEIVVNSRTGRIRILFSDERTDGEAFWETLTSQGPVETVSRYWKKPFKGVWKQAKVISGMAPESGPSLRK